MVSDNDGPAHGWWTVTDATADGRTSLWVVGGSGYSVHGLRERGIVGRSVPIQLGATADGFPSLERRRYILDDSTDEPSVLTGSGRQWLLGWHVGTATVVYDNDPAGPRVATMIATDAGALAARQPR